MKKKLLTVLAAGMLMLGVAEMSHATPYTVDAKLNSSTGGTGLSTIALTAGQAFTTSTDPLDLWSAGAIPRWSNANGLTGNLYATGIDESGQVAGTLIGQNWGTWQQNSFVAPYGELVGKIGSWYIGLGTSYSGFAPVDGTLTLYYWDSINGDNTEHITVDVSAVPEPGTMMLLGIGMVGLAIFGKRRMNKEA